MNAPASLAHVIWRVAKHLQSLAPRSAPSV